MFIASLISPACGFLVSAGTPLARFERRFRLLGAQQMRAAAAPDERAVGDVRMPRGAALRAWAASAVCAIGSAQSALAGTVMVGGSAVGAEEEMDEEASDVLEESSGGPLDFILEKVNLKKLGFWGATFLVADTVSGVVMGRSFLKIVSGSADPNDWKTKVVDKYYKPGEGKLDLGAGAMGSSADLEALEQMVADKIASNKVMMFSKTNCPFCKNAKAALEGQGIPYEAMELDKRQDGQNIQDIMLKRTGARSVPRVFMNGKFIGGGDDTCALAASGKLKDLYRAE